MAPPVPHASLAAPGAFVKFGQDGDGDDYGWRIAQGAERWTVQIVPHGDGRARDTGLPFADWTVAVAAGDPRPRLDAWFHRRPSSYVPLAKDQMAAAPGATPA